MTWRPICAIVECELIHMARQRGRLVSALVRPMLWLFVIGSGVNAMLGQQVPHGYPRFLVPGVLGMTMLFGAMLVALSLVYDQELGVMRRLITASLPHYWIVLANPISAAVVAVVQATVLLLVLIMLGYLPGETSPALLLGGFLTTALVCASLGMLAAMWTSSLENFPVIMNTIISPVFFLSGAPCPTRQLPIALRILATINPFSYGVDLLKHAVLG